MGNMINGGKFDLQQLKRSGEIDVLKVLFAFIILIYHFHEIHNDNWFIRGYLGV